MPTIRLAELHPIVVHFPIALLIVSVGCDIAAVFLRRAGLTTTATWTLVFGVPGAGAALLSGWLSEHDVSAALAGSILHLHKVCAVLTTVLFGTLLVLRLIWLLPRVLYWAASVSPVALPAVAGAGGRLKSAVPVLYAQPLPRAVVALYLVLSVVGLVLLAVTGYLGGSLVYDHGVGIPLPAPASPSAILISLSPSAANASVTRIRRLVLRGRAISPMRCTRSPLRAITPRLSRARRGRRSCVGSGAAGVVVWPWRLGWCAGWWGDAGLVRVGPQCSQHGAAGRAERKHGLGDGAGAEPGRGAD